MSRNEKYLSRSSAIFIVFLVLVLGGCDTAFVAVTGITVEPGSVSVTVGNVSLLNATLEPVEASDTRINWSSSDETVVEVSESGIVIGMGEGTATITATTEDGGFSDSCEVLVGTVGITGISLNPHYLNIDIGAAEQIGVIINPANATNHEVVWDIADTEVASIDENGLVTGIAKGVTFVTVSTLDVIHTAISTVIVEFFPTSGRVEQYQKISDTEGSFTGVLDDIDLFGCSLTSIGDLDNDGVDDLVVGVRQDDDGGADRGAVWVLFMNSDGTVDSYQKISDTEGGFTGILDDNDSFGTSLSSIGDLDKDGVEDLVVGAYYDDDGGTNRGAVWVLFMNSNGTVDSYQKISDTEGGFTGILDDNDSFGISLSSIGDLDKDGVEDLVVGAFFDDDGGSDRGAVWVLFMNSDGTVAAHQKISDTEGGFTGILDDADFFGSSLTGIRDLDNNEVDDLVVGAYFDDDGGTNRGAVWILFMNSDGTVDSYQKISDTEGGFNGILDDFGFFGYSLSSIGDLNIDRNGVDDLVVGAYFDDDGGTNRGAVWILFMNSDGTVDSYQKISDTEGGFNGILDDEDSFGISLTGVRDLNSDGVDDLVVGAVADDDGGSDRGAVWVLFMEEE